MFFAKIIVKNDYKEKGDLVFRPLLRAYKEIGADMLVERGNAILIGIVDKDGIFHEWFTGNEFYCQQFKEIDMGEVYVILNKVAEVKDENGKAASLNIDITDVINKYVFKRSVSLRQDNQIEFETYPDEKQRIADDAEDLRIEHVAYEKGLSVIDPYDKENLCGYRDFLYKVSKLNELGLNKSK